MQHCSFTQNSNAPKSELKIAMETTTKPVHGGS